MKNNDTTRITCRAPCRYSPRYRAILATCLTILCIPVFFYHLVPAFTVATDNLITKFLQPVDSRGDSCTSEIGNWHCCVIFLDASPCLDECSRQNVDRETLRLTREYDECADVCLSTYNNVCAQKREDKLLEGLPSS